MNAAQIGQSQYAQSGFNEPFALVDVFDNNVSAGYMRVQRGWGFMGHRVLSDPEQWTPRVISHVTTAFANLSIVSVSGALLGKIRTDVQKTIVAEMEFTNDVNGCADFVLRLNALPDFPILPFSLLSVNIGETEFDWYCGVVNYTDEIGTQRDLYEFKGQGLRTYLKTLRALTTYTVGMDIGEIVYDLCETWIAPYCPILLNSSKIDQVTGVVLASDIELSNSPIDTILQTLGDMAGCDWGVDGDRELFFRTKSTTVQRTLFVGYDLNDFKPKLNLADIKNAIIVQRQQGLGSGGAGWAIAGIFNDATSIKKYGKKELTYQIPGYFDDDDADVVGNAMLDEKKDPKLSATASGFRIRYSTDYLTNGNYRIIMPYDLYDDIYSDVDVLAEWTKYGTGDLALSKYTDFFVHGDGCLQLAYDTALNDRAEYVGNFRGNIKKIRFYVRASKTGAFLTVGVGLTNWNEYTTLVDIPIANIFFNFDWDVSSLNISEINKFAIRIDEGNQDAQMLVYIDKIEFQIEGYKYYNLVLKKSGYVFKPAEQVASMEFGVLPPKMENYMAGLMAAANELKFVTEIR